MSGAEAWVWCVAIICGTSAPLCAWLGWLAHVEELRRQAPSEAR